MSIVLLFASIFALALAAAVGGIRMALQWSSPSAARTPALKGLVIVGVLAALLVFPALFVVARCLTFFAGESSNGAQAGVLVLIIALGCSTLAGMSLTLVLVARAR
jgi:hypothetical protein